MPIFLIMCGIDIVFVNYFTHDVKRKISTQLLSIFSYVHEKEYEFMKKRILLIVFLIPISMMLFAQVKPVVVVAPFDAKGVDKDEIEVITELFTAEYANAGFASVVDRNSFDKIKEQLKFQSSDWSNADKVAQLGKALNANHVVVGQILKFKEKFIVTIKIIDVNTTTILASHTEKIEDIETFLDDIPEICIVLSSKIGSVSKKEYKIGERGEGGGIVFYISSEGFDVYDGKGGVMRCHYLEMSKTDLGESYFGCDRIEMNNRKLGDGKSNTDKIVNLMIWRGKTPTVDNCAAYRCVKYKTPASKEGEWFLPSNEEAKLIIATQAKQLGDNTYWTSSSKMDDSLKKDFQGKGDPPDKWIFYRAGIFNASKVGSTLFGYEKTRYLVRAIRAF